MLAKSILVLLAFISFVDSRTEEIEEALHKDITSFYRGEDISIEDANFWINDAQERIKKKVQVERIENVAKNVIFYIGDGMSIHTLTAARILKGQAVDFLQYGEEAELYLESFPFTGISKTFCSDLQVADSSCAATALFSGAKANGATIGVTTEVIKDNCNAQTDATNHLSSVLAWAQAKGKSTGIVTTSRVTEPVPAGSYAHAANSGWENDAAVVQSGGDPSICEDIARQLITREPGININVILGGGRSQLTPKTVPDPEIPNMFGVREDNINLIDSWISDKAQSTAKYVTDRNQLLGVNTSEIEYLLGLFSPSQLSYLDEQEANNDPSLEEMTKVAIEILSKNPNGFFLFVGNGRIKDAHNQNMLHRALWETLELDKAIKAGDEATSDEDTLILVTADHSTALTFAGYPARGTPIVEFPKLFLTTEFLPYNTIGYPGGPGPVMHDANTGRRKSIWGHNFYNRSYQVPSPLPLEKGIRGGDDVLIFAKGPYAHFIEGVQQQSYIPHVIGYSACIGDGKVSQQCKQQTNPPTTVTMATTSTSDEEISSHSTDKISSVSTEESTPNGGIGLRIQVKILVTTILLTIINL